MAGRARITGWGAFLFVGGGMGCRVREDNGTRAGSCSGGEGWVGGFARTTEGAGSAGKTGEGVVGFCVCCLLLCGFAARGEVEDLYMKVPCVYLLASKPRGTLYVGATSDLVQRVWQHKGNLVDGFTRQYRVHRLVWYEVHESMESARAREKALKKWYRAWKVRLIEEGNPRWLDLYEGIV